MRAHGKNQSVGRDKLLSVGEVARRLRVSADVVRSLTESGQLKAARTGGGHRRFRAEEVERYKTQAHAQARTSAPTRPARKPAVRADLGGLEFEDEDPPTLEEPEAEFERQQARERAEIERQRLEALKNVGRDLAPWTLLPAEGQARILEDLEEFVTGKRFPESLPSWQAEGMVRARVSELADQYRQAENERRRKEREVEDERRRAAEERRRSEQEAEEHRRKQEDDERRQKALIDHGVAYARRETITGWDTSEADKARREVDRTLRDKVRPHWSEADVRDLVDNVLGQWADDDDDDDYDDDDEDGYEEDEEGEAEDESW